MTTFRELEAFVAVVDMGSFEKAARSLDTTQSGISRLISDFESQFQPALFNRDNRSARITMEGQEVLRVARAMLQQRSSILEKFGNAEVITPVLRLGVSELASVTWLGAYIARLRERYPRMHLELQVHSSPILHALLRDGQLDVAIVVDVIRSTDMARIPIGKAEFGWYASPEISLPDRLSREYFEEQTLLIQVSATGAGTYLARWFAENSLQPKNTIYTDNLSALAGISAAGLGLASLPKAMALDPVKRGVLKEIDVPFSELSLNYIALIRIDAISDFHRTVAQIAKDCCDFNTPFHGQPRG